MSGMRLRTETQEVMKKVKCVGVTPAPHAHSEPGGGTIVSRDRSGEVHVFFGHVCGNVIAYGDTLEEFYRSLRGYNGVKEVFLK